MAIADLIIIFIIILAGAFIFGYVATVTIAYFILPIWKLIKRAILRSQKNYDEACKSIAAELKNKKSR